MIARARIVTALNVAVLSTETVAIGCQFIQRTDPRFPLVYFSVGSAMLAALAAGLTLGLPRWRHLAALRLTAAVGVIVSAVVFAAVIAPATPTGSWIQPHMHGVAPPLVALDWALRRRPFTLRRHIVLGFGWPLAYLSGIACAAVAEVALPYPFLSPAQMGWLAVLGSVAALAVLVTAVSALLFAIQPGAARTSGSSPGNGQYQHFP